ncbi:hypothetical protein [Oceanospirillum sediminis]|uniref:ATP-grasp domain-containing protein n=1 Tax=Oceanospirillum sediminis TaxID=2760088 RepID=A0A839IMT4_9GAMM|nr:hypothetical protein [Oceanospirillum sediminis]MBB1485787.1 hypothetical protein [Oceanospirillum sediminis]
MIESNVSKEFLDELILECRNIAHQVELIFITNLIDGDIQEYTENGLSMTSQYYKESDVSFVLQTFEKLGFSVRPFYNEIDFIKWASNESNIKSSNRWQMVITTAEGGEGEGRRALIPSFCNLIGLPCWNSPAHGCSVARHKFHANKILSSCGIKVPETWYFLYERLEWMHNSSPDIGTKVIIKPAWEGTSKGIDEESIIVVDDDFSNVVSIRAHRFGQSCVVQEFKTGYEVGVPIIAPLSPKAVGLIGFADGDKLRYGQRARTFVDENIKKTAQTFLFDELPSLQAKRALTSAERAFDVLSMKGLGRIDMRIDEDGEAWIFDTNESPPLLPRSSFVQLFEKIGYDFKDVISIMIAANITRYNQMKI